MKISALIVSYNTAAIIPATLESLLQQQNVNVEIIVIDNASQDNSLAVLKNYGDKIKVIPNPTNSGFGKANNLAFQHSCGDYIFLLNPDAVLEDTHGLEKLVHFIQTHQKHGIVGPEVTKNQRITAPQLFYPGQKHLKHALPNLPGKIAWIIGAAMFIPREVYQKTGGFDERFFLYGEEADLCLAVRKMGLEIGFCPDVKVRHIGGVSEKTNSIENLWSKKQNGLHLFYEKNYSAANTQKLLKHDMREAQKHLKLLQLKKLFLPQSQRIRDKIRRYKVVYATSQESLKRLTG